MKFGTKVFLAILCTTTVSCIAVAALIYSVMKKDIETEYFERYKLLGKIISNTFHQMEVTTDIVNKNAVNVLALIEKNRKLPGNAELNVLAKQLGINSFYVIDKNGKFIRSSDLPLKLQVNSLFKYSSRYRLLVDGNLNVALTPILPGFPYGIPAKFTLIPNYNRTLILEADTQLQYIEKILHNVISSDSSIQSIGLYAPTGYALGYIDAAGKFYQGKSDTPGKMFLGEKVINNTAVFSIQVPAVVQNCIECVEKGVSKNGKYYYILTTTVSLSPLYSRLHALRYDLFFILLLVLVISVLISKWLSKKLVDRITIINRTASAIMESGNLDLRVIVKNGKDELTGLANRFNEMIEALKKSQEKLVENERMRAIAQVAAQVAHDIRSPLGALQVIATNTKQLPEQERTVLRSAIARINGIAHNLLAKYKKGALTSQDCPGVQPEIIYFLLEAVISEKRLLLPAQRIDFVAADTVIPLCANVNDSEFKRVLSNILNNAIEATETQTDGKVTVQLLQQEEQITIEVTDNGCGIAPDLIPKILQGGVSIGKPQGSGLGISSAIKTIAGWGGHYDLQSQIGQGTTFRIHLPRVPAPLWFTAQLSLPENTAVYVVDDDETVHFVWRERFEQITGDFYRPEELIQFVQQTPVNNALFLIDYEFIQSELTGLALIQQLNLASQAILVTSRYEDPCIREQAIELGVKIIPKLYAQHIPILRIPSAQTIVLLDDDLSLTQAWQLKALLTGKTLRTYHTAEALWADLPQFNSHTIFYIDVELGDDKNGLTIARQLYEHGYSEIYLASGHDSSYFTEPLPWLKGIVGKVPPF